MVFGVFTQFLAFSAASSAVPIAKAQTHRLQPSRNGFHLQYRHSRAKEAPFKTADSNLNAISLQLLERTVAFGIKILETVCMASSTRFLACISLLVLLVFPHSSIGQKTKQKYGLSFSLFKGQSAPSKELLDTLSREAFWDDFSEDMNPTGLRLRFVKIDEQAAPGGRIADRYRVYVDGAPESKVFAFATWPINEPLVYDPRDIYVNGQGLLLIHKPKPEQEMSLTAPDDELVVVATTASAEPVRYLFAKRDKKLSVFGTLVPHPLKSEEQGCKLEARIAAPDASSVLIVADGFPAKAKIPLVLESEGLTFSASMMADQDGHAVMAAFPYVSGKTQGTLRATAEGPDCLPTVVLPWGSAAPAPVPAQKNP
jgi:hypothetical protein